MTGSKPAKRDPPIEQHNPVARKCLQSSSNRGKLELFRFRVPVIRDFGRPAASAGFLISGLCSPPSLNNGRLFQRRITRRPACTKNRARTSPWAQARSSPASVWARERTRVCTPSPVGAPLTSSGSVLASGSAHELMRSRAHPRSSVRVHGPRCACARSPARDVARRRGSHCARGFSGHPACGHMRERVFARVG